MNYPSIETVAIASRELLCRWWRFLACPSGDEEMEVMDAICDRHHLRGGWSLELSKKIGWEE